jgi:hypothetical protein
VGASTGGVEVSREPFHHTLSAVRVKSGEAINVVLAQAWYALVRVRQDGSAVVYTFPAREWRVLCHDGIALAVVLDATMGSNVGR